MKNLFISFLLGLALFSCKKNEIEFISHDSDIFTGKDTLIYGSWEYLYTSFDNIGGGHSEKEENRPSLIIKRFDNYEKILDNTVIISGKIDTVGNLWGYTKVIFYSDGQKDHFSNPQLLKVFHSDTLIYCTFIAIDAGIYDYYKRKLK